MLADDTTSARERECADADLILHNGKVVTVDPAFSVREGVAALSEAQAKLPVFDSIGTIQNYIGEKAKTTPEGAQDAYDVGGVAGVLRKEQGVD